MILHIEGLKEITEHTAEDVRNIAHLLVHVAGAPRFAGQCNLTFPCKEALDPCGVRDFVHQQDTPQLLCLLDLVVNLIVHDLTTHVLDTARGVPAAGLPIALEIEDGTGWRPLSQGVTNDDGRVADLVEGRLECAVYRISFDTDAYWAAQGITGFYPVARVVFRVTDPDSHHHVPLLLSPFGYSTYRGS